MNLQLHPVSNIPLQVPADFLAQLILFQKGILTGELAKHLFPLIYDANSSEGRSLLKKDVTALMQAPDKFKAALRSIKSENSQNDLATPKLVQQNNYGKEGKKRSLDETLEFYAAAKLSNNKKMSEKSVKKESSLVEEHVIAKDDKEANPKEEKLFKNDVAEQVVKFGKNQHPNFASNPNEDKKEPKPFNSNLNSNSELPAKAKPGEIKNFNSSTHLSSFRDKGQSDFVSSKENAACSLSPGNEKLNLPSKTPGDHPGPKEENDKASLLSKKSPSQEEFSQNILIKPFLENKDKLQQQTNLQLQNSTQTGISKGAEGSKPQFFGPPMFALPHSMEQKVVVPLPKTKEKFKFTRVKKREKRPNDDKDEEMYYPNVDDIS